MTGPRWAVIATLIGVALIATSLFTLFGQHPRLIGGWHELAGLVLGGGCLASAIYIATDHHD